MQQGVQCLLDGKDPAHWIRCTREAGEAVQHIALSALVMTLKILKGTLLDKEPACAST